VEDLACAWSCGSGVGKGRLGFLWLDLNFVVTFWVVGEWLWAGWLGFGGRLESNVCSLGDSVLLIAV
jgi:hypothetical protein